MVLCVIHFVSSEPQVVLLSLWWCRRPNLEHGGRAHHTGTRAFKDNL